MLKGDLESKKAQIDLNIRKNTMNSISDRIHSYLQDMEKKGRFSGVVHFGNRQNEEILRQSYGYSNYESDTATTVDNQFSVASIGKLFTGILIMELVERGSLTLTDPVSTLLPTAEVSAILKQSDQISLRQLLTHSAHHGNYMGFIESFNKIYTDQQITDYSFDKIYELVCAMDPIKYEQGEQARYSNSSFIVLGKILAHHYGKPYEDIIKERIFQKEGYEMVNSTMTLSDAKNLVQGYSNPNAIENDQNGTDPQWNHFEPDTNHKPKPLSDGGLLSTVGDLDVFRRAIFDKAFVGTDSLNQMFTAYTNPHNTSLSPNYGYATEVETNSPLYLKKIGHSGNTSYFDNRFYQYISEDISLIILSNIGNSICERIGGGEGILTHLESLIFSKQN